VELYRTLHLTENRMITGGAGQDLPANNRSQPSHWMDRCRSEWVSTPRYKTAQHSAGQ